MTCLPVQGQPIVLPGEPVRVPVPTNLANRNFLIIFENCTVRYFPVVYAKLGIRVQHLFALTFQALSSHVGGLNTGFVHVFKTPTGLIRLFGIKFLVCDATAVARQFCGRRSLAKGTAFHEWIHYRVYLLQFTVFECLSFYAIDA